MMIRLIALLIFAPIIGMLVVSALLVLLLVLALPFLPFM
jgi:hypothetical protein